MIYKLGFWRRWALALAIVCAVPLGGAVVPSASLASTTFGADLGAPATGTSACPSPPAPCTFMNTALPAGAPPLTSPVTGTIIRWRIKTQAGSSGTVTFRVIAPAGGGMFTGAGTGDTETTPTTATTTTFSTQLPIQAGDYVGVDSTTSGFLGALASAQSGAVFANFFPSLSDGGSPVLPSDSSANEELLVNADVAALPTSSVSVPACSDTGQLAAAVTSDPDPAVAPKAIHFRIDGGSELVIATTGNPGSATIAVPSGSHTLEYWGEDTVGGLESAHHTASVQVGGCATTPPTGSLGSSPPVVSGGAASAPSATSAGFSGSVNPDGLQTTAVFQYGLDPSYAGGGPIGYTNQVAASPSSVGSDFTSHQVTGTATGLVPNALYHVRLVATNSLGTTFSPDETFRTPKGPTPPAPVLGKSFNMRTVSGIMYVKFPGSSSGGSLSSTGAGFVPCLVTCHLPAGTQVDSRFGKFIVLSASGQKRKLFTGTFGGAIVAVSQSRSGSDKGVTTFRLLLGAFPTAPNLDGCSNKASRAAAGPLAEIASLSSVYHSRSRGRYRTRYGRASGSSLGTQWDTIVSCAGVRFKVFRDTVVVNDSARHKIVFVHAGQSYLAKR